MQPEGMDVGQTGIIYDDGRVAYDYPERLHDDFKKEFNKFVIALKNS
jgi:hypothetical protein